MEIAGYFASLLIGISLGLIGGGGSILTIPVLVYLFHIQPSVATGYSLCIVGFSSLAGAIENYRRKNINFKAAFYFGLASIVTVVLFRKLILPVIPEHIFMIDSMPVTKSLLTMILFAVVMVVASLQMIRKEAMVMPRELNNSIHFTKALVKGVEVGILTGLLGAGGGFLIIPVLIFSFHISMKEAIGTSLLIIAMNSLFGFASDLFHLSFNWNLLISLTVIAIMGTFIGRIIGQYQSGEKLKKWFGWFVLIMGIYILLRELIF